MRYACSLKRPPTTPDAKWLPHLKLEVFTMPLVNRVNGVKIRLPEPPDQLDTNQLQLAHSDVYKPPLPKPGSSVVRPDKSPNRAIPIHPTFNYIVLSGYLGDDHHLRSSVHQHNQSIKAVNLSRDALTSQGANNVPGARAAGCHPNLTCC